MIMSKFEFAGTVKFAAAMMAAAGMLAAVATQSSAQDKTISVFGHRYPFNNYYMDKVMKDALPGIKVEANLSGFAQFQEKLRISLTSKSDEVDLFACQGAKARENAKFNRIQPLDDLWEKYREEYNLDDIPAEIVDAMRYEGKLYGFPFGVNTMIFFYRKDLFDEKGVEPPKTMDEYISLAKMFNSPRRSGTQLSMKMVEMGINQLNWHFNAEGPGWLDDDTFTPVFNGPEGVEAIKKLMELAKYSAPGYLANANNEAVVNFQQDLAVMGLQWASRAAAMDDPEKSKVVGKIDFAVPAGGGSRVIVVGYCMSSYSDIDRETMFKLLLESSRVEKMRAGAAFMMPSRSSVLNDPEVQAQNRHFKMSSETIKVAKDVPPLPEYSEVAEFLVRRVHQAMTGELEIKEALDLAAGEVRTHLVKRGYDPK
jgi:ABC-type glycerol-3-phosphate transport system substrate-binding protein